MKIKRILAICMCLLMLFAVCGCGDDGKKSSGSSSGKMTTAEVDAVTFEGFKFKTNADLDFGGKTVKIVRDRGKAEYGICDAYDRELDILAYMEEKYNVKIEYIEYSGEDELIEQLVLNHMSGTAYGDIVFGITPAYLAALNNEGVFRAMDDYIDYSNDRFALTDAATQYVDGKHYSYYPTKKDAGYFLYYNTELLTNNNCEDPRELYEAGKWDWKAFETIAKACTGEKNGKTIYGLAGSNLLDGLMASNGMPMVSYDSKSSTVNCNLFTDAGKKVLDFVRTLTYVDKAVDGTYGSHNGIETFNNSYAAMLIGPQYYGSHLVQTGIPYEMVPLPIGPDTDSYTNICQYCYCYAISAHSEYKTEDLLQLAFELERNDPAIEGTYREDNYDGKLQVFIDEYVDQSNHYYDDTQAKFVYDFINDKSTVSTVDWVTTNLKSTIATEIYLPISKGEDVRSQLTAIQPVIETAIKDQF